MSISRWFAGLVVLGLGCGQPPLILDAGTSAPKPHVLLLVDTSGSTTYLAGCQCPTFGGCSPCLPDCSTDARPRWHDMLAALGGSFENYSCTALERTGENGATYDEGYALPFYRLGQSVRQRSDGLLDRYKDDVQFGIATFDGIRTYTGSSDLVTSLDPTLSIGSWGQFSYGSALDGPRIRPDGTVAGRVRYPTTTQAHFIDSGIKNASATDGALILPGDAADPSEVIASIKSQLMAVRPFGGTPTGSALDDLYVAFTEGNAAAVQAKRYVILLTDGYPDDDFREYPNPGCDCAARGNCPPDEDPALMSCPYPAAAEAARVLRCGYDPSMCAGPVTKTHVVTLSVSDQASRVELEAMAAAGGGEAFHASSAAGINTALDAALASILRDAAL